MLTINIKKNRLMGCSIQNIKIIEAEKKRKELLQLMGSLWDDYQSKANLCFNVKNELVKKVLSYRDKQLLFDFVVKGEVPSYGYPLYLCLHNGEINRSATNNSEYTKIKIRYISSITVGVCLFVRGLTDLSNMHYSDESYVFYDRLLQDMIIFQNVNSNKIYLIGIGLGGDAVYQIAARMPDRFAGISVISGHSYGVNVKNLFNLPMMISVGELDYVFDKNKDAVKVSQRVKELRELNNISDVPVVCNIFVNKNKHINDYNNSHEIQTIFTNPMEWMTNNNQESTQKNINSISFLSQFIRNPLPKKIIWDLTKLVKFELINFDKILRNNYILEQTQKMKKVKAEHLQKTNQEILKVENTALNNGQEVQTTNNQETNQDKGGKVKKQLTKEFEEFEDNQFYYWLEIGNKTIEELGGIEIIARYDKSSNTIFIDSPVKYVRILLCEEMVDFNKEINFIYKGNSKSLLVIKNYKTQKRTLMERGDKNFIFSASVLFETGDLNHFKIVQYDEN